MHTFSDYPGDPPDPVLKLEIANEDGVCDYCGYPYKAGEVVDGDAFDDAAFVDGDGDGFSALLQPKPGKASEFHD